MTSIISVKQLSEDTEIVLLISNIERLKTKISEENKKINLCIHIHEQENPTYCGYAEQLKIEVSHIRDKLNLSFSEKKEQPDFEVTEDLKLLYRKISIKCHPDKTKNTNYHELFKNAKTAYETLDYSKLKKIYEELYDKIPESEDTVENLKKQLKKVEKEYIELTKTAKYLMTSYYNSEKTIDKMKSKKLFLDLIFSEIFELETLKSNLTT